MKKILFSVLFILIQLSSNQVNAKGWITSIENHSHTVKVNFEVWWLGGIGSVRFSRIEAISKLDLDSREQLDADAAKGEHQLPRTIFCYDPIYLGKITHYELERYLFMTLTNYDGKQERYLIKAHSLMEEDKNYTLVISEDADISIYYNPFHWEAAEDLLAN